MLHFRPGSRGVATGGGGGGADGVGGGVGTRTGYKITIAYLVFSVIITLWITFVPTLWHAML